MKRTQILLVLLLCLCLVVTSLPVTAFAANATVCFLDITMDDSGNPTACTYKTTDPYTEGILIENGTYTFSAAYDGIIIVNDANVTYSDVAELSRFGSTIYVFGSGSFAASNVKVTKGSYADAYRGSDGEALLTFIGSLPDDARDYSYTLNDEMALDNFLTTYDLTVPTGKTLTINAPAEGQDQPGFYRLIVKSSLTVSGTLTAAEGQVLEIGKNAAVTGSGLTLYDTNGTSAYTFASTHNTEEFSYTNDKWVRQTSGGSEGGGSGGDGGSDSGDGGSDSGEGSQTTAPAVSFRVQNSSTAVGTVKYKIGSGGNWTNVVLNPSGETPNQYLSGTVTDTLAQNNIIYIKATPADGYEIAASRGVNVSTDNSTGSAISGGASAIVSTDGLSYTLTENRSYEFEFGFQTSGSDPGDGDTPPADTPDYAAAKTGIESRHWAYFAGTADAMKTAFSTELWDMLSHKYSGVFENSDAVSTAVTLSAGTATDGSELGSSYPYYTYSVILNEENTATGKIYVLGAANNFVVRTTVGGTNTFTVMTAPQSGDAVLVKDYDAGGIEVFGNSAAAVGTLGSTDSSVAYQVTPHFPVTNAINCTLVVYKPGFAGAQLTRGSTNGRAAAWDFGSYPMAAFGTSQAAPTEFRTYFGDSSVTLAVPSGDGIDIRTITDVSTTLPQGAVTITKNGGTFTVTFHSNFYDQVPLTIRYLDSKSTPKTGYLLINRVGIDIQCYRKAGNASGSDLTLLHGTQNGATYTNFYAENECGVFATFYYPKNNTQQVELVATYTWQDGSVTRQTISNPMRTGAENSADLVASDDFQLYAGTAAGLPVKIEVTAVKTGSSGTNFAGASLGSGAGVVWVCPDSLRS